MAYNHSFCMFCGQTLPEGSPARNTPRPLCDPCQQRDTQGQRLCPACKETIQVGATLCRFCQSPLVPGAGGAPGGNVSTYAVGSLVAGIFGPFFCGIPAILAIVFGFLALKEIRASDGAVGGSGIAKWGRGLGIAWLVLGFVFVVLAFLNGFLAGTGGQ